MIQYLCWGDSMDNPILQTIKIITMFIAGAIILGTIGALALAYGVAIAGAVCFLIAGILIGVLIGTFLQSIVIEEGDQ